MEHTFPSKKDQFEETNLLIEWFSYSSFAPINNVTTSAYSITMVIVWMCIVFVPMFILRMVQEKNSGIREYFRTMGLSTFVNYSSWFLHGFIVLLFVSFLPMIMLSVNTFGDHSEHAHVFLYNTNKLLFWLFLMIYMVHLILFSMFISIFFNNGIMAVIFSVIMMIASALIPILAMDSVSNDYVYASIPTGAKVASCLLPNAALYWGIKLVLASAVKGIGMDWDTLQQGYLNGDNFNIGIILLSMCCYWIVYGVLIWYFDAVWPWQKGYSKPFYFPFMKSYWIKSSNKVANDSSRLLNFNQSFHEDLPVNQKIGIDIDRLTKKFNSGLSSKTVVDEINLQMFEGQITGLLGHNGAGKTTTISMITGIFPPTSGNIQVNGKDVSTDLSCIRKSLGYCPQHSLFVPELTVKEHLEMVAIFRRVKMSQLHVEVADALQQVNLVEKQNSKASTLSGGMLRKLSLGMALVGQTKVLLLDEPTSGLDPEARKEVWNILQSIRPGRSILLTTHYMEEADALSDRIAIMYDGKIFCSGSPLFLKIKFGAGYHLRMIMDEGCNPNKVLDIVEKYVEAKIERQSGRELSLIITSETTENFPQFLNAFESNLKELKIKDFALSVTTMEDVFLNVGNEAANAKVENETPTEKVRSSPIDQTSLLNCRKVDGLNLVMLQFYGLICKRFHYTRRQLSLLILQVFMPLAIIGLLVVIFNLMFATKDNQKMVLRLGDIYQNTITPMSSNCKQASDLYRKALASSGTSIQNVKNVTKFALDKSTNEFYQFQYFDVIGGELKAMSKNCDGDWNLTAFASPFSAYSMMISTNLMNNVKLKRVIGNSHIEAARNPLKLNVENNYFTPIIATLLTAIIFPLAIGFLSSATVLMVINERISKSKHLQLMTGVNPMLFWFSHFLWDFIICFTTSLFMIVILVYGSGMEKVSSLKGPLVTNLFFYHLSSIPLMYLLGNLFKKPSSGFCVAAIASFILSSVFCVLTLSILELNETAEDIITGIFYVMQCFPPVSLTKAVTKLMTEAFGSKVCLSILKYCPIINKQTYAAKLCCQGKEGFNPYGLKSTETGLQMIVMAFTGLFYIFLLFLIRMETLKIYWRKFFRRPTIHNTSEENIDSDVLEEENRVESLIENHGYENGNNKGALIVHNMRKEFKKLVAVDNISFSVPKEKCFGLLGINGAGKTTTFSMLTGDLAATSGDAYICPFSAIADLHTFQKQIGYCPQNDALLELLTGEELMYLFARLRGISNSRIKPMVKSLVSLVNLEEYASLKCSTYSGGNKRKLNIALAIIGMPPMLFLDEPTAGVDPIARRQIWNLLTGIKKSGVTVILTSHSMEECEALCDELTIMVKGRLQCIGNLTHLKSKFGQGFTIVVKINLKNDGNDSDVIDGLSDSIHKEIPTSRLQYQNLGLLTYHVSNPKEKWSKMFDCMEQIKNEQRIENFSVSSTSLEQVFLAFAEGKYTSNIELHHS